MKVRELLSQIHSIVAKDNSRYDNEIQILDVGEYGWRDKIDIGKVECMITEPVIILRMKND